MLHLVQSRSRMHFNKADLEFFNSAIDNFNATRQSNPYLDLHPLYRKMQTLFEENDFSCYIGGHHFHIEKSTGSWPFKKHGSAFLIDLDDVGLADETLNFEDRCHRIAHAIHKDHEKLILATTKNIDYLYSMEQLLQLKSSQHESVRELAKKISGKN